MKFLVPARFLKKGFHSDLCFKTARVPIVYIRFLVVDDIIIWFYLLLYILLRVMSSFRALVRFLKKGFRSDRFLDVAFHVGVR